MKKIALLVLPFIFLNQSAFAVPYSPSVIPNALSGCGDDMNMDHCRQSTVESSARGCIGITDYSYAIQCKIAITCDPATKRVINVCKCNIDGSSDGDPWAHRVDPCMS